MDNASKALILAGAVLIAVLIVSLGVYLLNLNAPVVDTTVTQIDLKAVQSYNYRYTKYEGFDKSSSEVIALINAVDQHNRNTTETDIYGEITLTGVNSRSSVQPTQKYDIIITGYDSRGVIDSIDIN